MQCVLKEVAEGDREGLGWISMQLQHFPTSAYSKKKKILGKGDSSHGLCSAGFLLTKEVTVQGHQEILSLGHK